MGSSFEVIQLNKADVSLFNFSVQSAVLSIKVPKVPSSSIYESLSVSSIEESYISSERSSPFSGQISFSRYRQNFTGAVNAYLREAKRSSISSLSTSSKQAESIIKQEFISKAKKTAASVTFQSIRSSISFEVIEEAIAWIIYNGGTPDTELWDLFLDNGWLTEGQDFEIIDEGRIA